MQMLWYSKMIFLIKRACDFAFWQPTQWFLLAANTIVSFDGYQDWYSGDLCSTRRTPMRWTMWIVPSALQRGLFVEGDYAGRIYVSVSTRHNTGGQDPAHQFPNQSMSSPTPAPGFSQTQTKVELHLLDSVFIISDNWVCAASLTSQATVD